MASNVEAQFFPMRGGLDLLTPIGQADPGTASDMRNFEVTLSGAFRRIDGYERYDGKPAPHLGEPPPEEPPPEDPVIDLPEEMIKEGVPVYAQGVRGEEPAVLEIPLGGVDLSGGTSFDHKQQFALSVHNNPVYHYLEGDFPTQQDFLDAIMALGGIELAEVSHGSLWITTEVEPYDGGDPAVEVIVAQFPDYREPPEPDDEDTRRQAIQAPPGEGPILGLAVFQGYVIAARDVQGDSYLYVAGPDGWEGLTLPNTRIGGGHIRFAQGNFTGNPGDQALYMVDGLNPPLEIKGEGLLVEEIEDCKVEVGALTLYPHLVEVHKGHLFVGYPAGSVQHSAIGDPFSWDTTGGAGEIAVGEQLVEIKVLMDDALGIFTEDSVRVLYGTSAADWTVETMGANQQGVRIIPGTVQSMGQPLFADKLGVRSLATTSAFGNFRLGTMTLPVKPLYDDMQGGIRCSAVFRRKNQYRLFADGGHVLSLTTDGEELVGAGYTKLPMNVVCAASGELDDGSEIVVVGADNGWVYRLDVGDTFDGEPIDATLQLHFNHLGTPRNHKRYRKAVFDMFAPVEFDMLANLSFNYGGQDHAQHIEQVTDITGAYGLWNVSEWGTFRWGGQYMSEGEIDITGSGRTLSLLLHCEGKIPAFEMYGVTLHYSVRRLQR